MNVVHEATWPEWENIALNLARSARVLWEAFINESPAINVNMHVDVTASFHTYTHAPVMLLWGLSLEAIAKAILTKQEMDRSGRATAALPKDATTGHPLPKLLERAGVPLSTDELEFAERLECFVGWAAKYPYPKRTQAITIRVIQLWEEPMFELMLEKGGRRSRPFRLLNVSHIDGRRALVGRAGFLIAKPRPVNCCSSSSASTACRCASSWCSAATAMAGRYGCSTVAGSIRAAARFPRKPRRAPRRGRTPPHGESGLGERCRRFPSRKGGTRRSIDHVLRPASSRRCRGGGAGRWSQSS